MAYSACLFRLVRQYGHDLSYDDIRFPQFLHVIAVITDSPTKRTILSYSPGYGIYCLRPEEFTFVRVLVRERGNGRAALASLTSKTKQ